ncbi:unnamed protein product [Phyllotreta striolata]|uniref:Golgi apparatus protein 1 n=1 Tax=Phyllotreta striolata TaxID=444603 RepID=A0A9N9XW85_PHYSR|nr:unnamed protein product [Phyllotreta striolata]
MHCWLFFLFNLFLTHTLLESTDNVGVKNLMNEPPCREVSVICGNLSDNDDLLVLECLLNSNPQQVNNLNSECQTIIWERVKDLISYKKVYERLKPVCGRDLTSFQCPKDNYLKCLASDGELKDKVSNLCYKAVTRLENIAFTDYKWIYEFLRECENDIKTLHCGVIDADNFSNLKVVMCLQNNILNVGSSCKKEIFHLAELQSVNIKWDAQLNVDCREDYQRYCNDYVQGSGRVFPCLMKILNTEESKITTKCRQHLKRREKLISQDFKISKGLLKACKEDIKRTSCRQKVSSEKTVRLAQILLCLEDFERRRSADVVELNPECQDEIIVHRKMLLNDYNLSPEVVFNCKNETTLYCQSFSFGGKTLHCLMGHALNTGGGATKLGATCLRALEDLMHETDPAENWNVDPVLRQSCDPVVKIACNRVTGGNGRVISCLMDNIRSDVMTIECENALLEIQYFVARDFELDPQLYKACNKDARKYCHFDSDTPGPSYSSQVLPCLYRHSGVADDKIDKQCFEEILRVMRQRAISVNLQPQIEEACVQDLGYYCRDKIKKGEEMQCLQDNLENLDEKCQVAVDDFTEMEAQRVELNPYLSKYCAKIIQNLCANDDDVVECLIENKNHVQVKSAPNCRASIEHFQIVSLKDYKFTFKFKQACKPYVIKLCGRAATKSAIIECLSEQILNATVHGLKSGVPKECRQQLKAQLFQQREKIDYNPSLKRACAADIDKFCKNVPVGNAQILECLQMVQRDSLSPSCAPEIFKAQKLQAFDNSIDYALLSNCDAAIDLFCPHHERESVFECLKANMDEKGFNKKCRQIVVHRLMERNTNYQLNPSLQKNCALDMNKFCKRELKTADRKPEDSIIKCLKNQFKLSKLSTKCEQEMAEILRERALDVNMDPLLRVMCKQELETICKSDEDVNSGRTVECLKNAFLNRQITAAECKVEVAGLIEGSEADIQADPLLQRACAMDLLTHCKDVEQGNGRKIGCLKTVMAADREMSPECKSKLRERLEMYKNAAQVVEVPADFQDLYRTVSLSPSKNYFVIVIFMILGTIFFVGAFCGRFSKRKYRLLKNK